MQDVNRALSTSETAWTRNGLHILQAAPEVILQKNFVWQTEDGLCYDKQHMYIGPSERAQHVWSQSLLRNLSPCLESQECIILPFTTTTMEKREEYILHYLSKVIRMRTLANQIHADFLCPESKEFVDVLHMFDWGAPKIPVIKYEKDQQIYCHSALISPVSDNTHVLPEDIASLRTAVRGWQEVISEPRILVFVEDGTSLTTDVVQELEEKLENSFTIRVVYPGRTSAERWWDVMRGAWGVVFGGKSSQAWGWNWLLPKGAYVFEVGYGGVDARNLSAAADLSHRFIKTAKDIQQEIDLLVTPQQTQTGPIVWLPRKDLEGFFAHPGDSFREMARLWGERGYVQVKEHPTATMCWWGSVGQNGILLYDRPTHEWRLAAPKEETTYAAALFGNPTPPEGLVNGKPWFFWPRRPALVEELVKAGAHNTTWSERREGPVFYGKIENKVQERRRTGAKQPDWSLACEYGGEWSMIKGAETKYPLTQKEYLERLAKARFGLCLPGYGWKCHREVECMAMGCVPLVAPDVDMESYANPPVHGTHYLRVETPEEAAAIARAMPKERWEDMSAACKTWWLANASCEGSFALTKKLCM